MAVLVANPTPAAITRGLNTIPAHAILSCTLAAGDADSLLASGCTISPTIGPNAQEASYMLQRNPGAT